MPDLLDEISDYDSQKFANILRESLPYDPGQPPKTKGLPSPRSELPYELRSQVETEPPLPWTLFKKGLWGGLGILGWPFQRIEYSIATPMTAALEARRKTMEERGIDKGFSVIAPRFIKGAEAKREYDEVITALGSIGKPWIPGEPVPDTVKTFNDFFGSYYSALTGEEAPEWYKTISGGGTSVLVTPYLFGKILKGIAGAGKMTGIPQKIAARQLPAWKKLRLIAKAETGERIDKAQDLGKAFGNREIKKLAKELSNQTGRNITPNAVRLRLTQIIKGGITTRPELAAKANPVIQEVILAGDELKKLGILPEYTYVSKLPKKEIADLLKQKRELEKQLSNLSKPPSQEALKKLAERLKVKGVPATVNKINKIAENLGKQSPRLQERFLRVMLKTEKVDEKILSQLSKIEGKNVSDIEKIITRLESVATKPVLSKTDTRSLATTIKQLQKKSARLSEDLTKILDIKAVDEKSITEALTKIAGMEETKMVKIAGQLEELAGRVQAQEITGLPTLLKKISSMTRRFPGKAAKTAELEAKIAGITRTVQTSYKQGGTGYFPRMYLTKEEERAARRISMYSSERIRAKYAIKRQDIPEEARKAMGEIKDPRAIIRRLIQEGADIETAKLFQAAANNPAWVSSTWQNGFATKALPDTKPYGALRGKFVKQRIYDDVTELIKVKGQVESLYDAGIGYWKLGKVVFNPATHFRNMFSNSILLDLSGMDHAQQVKYMTKALGHIKKGSKDYNEAKKFFMHTTQVKGEIFDEMLRSFTTQKGEPFRRLFNTANKLGKTTAKVPSEIYQAEEFMGKFMKYLQMRDKGMSVMDSVMEANKWLFDYSDLAGWEKNIARRIMPFYTFPRKALPRVLEAAANNPLTVAKYPMIAKGMMQYSLYNLEISNKDWEGIETDLPDYMKNGNYILMPYRDQNGDLRFLDWTYLVPWGELYEANERGLLKVGITNPLFQLVADIRANKSGWTDRKIYDDAIPPEKQTEAYRREQNLKKMLYVWQGLVPSLAYKGIYWDKLYGAATGKKSRGKDMLLPEAIAHTLFGARTQAIDPQEQRRWRLLELNEEYQELRGNMLKVLMQNNNGDITKEEFEKKWDTYIEQMQKLHTDTFEEEEDMPTTEELLEAIDNMVEE
jgi:hypothetical protein